MLQDEYGQFRQAEAVKMLSGPRSRPRRWPRVLGIVAEAVLVFVVLAGGLLLLGWWLG